jgi:two-component system sensor histidine kinase KdpD
VGTVQTWAASERILVCVGPSPVAAQLVRAAKRLATAFHAPWYAACVETPATINLSSNQRSRLADTLELAEQLGGETVTLSGSDIADELLSFARQKNITKIVIGKPEQPRWREWLFGSIVDDLIRHSGSIDVYVIRHERDKGVAPRPREIGTIIHWGAYAWAGAICLLATALGMLVYHVLGNQGDGYRINALMIQLLAVLVVATRFGRGPAIAASILAVAAFDFTVVPPYYTFAVSDSQYLFTFAVMLVTALIISTLTDRIRRLALAARHRERRTAALLSLSRELAATREKREIVQAVIQHVAGVFDSTVSVFMPNAKGELALAGTSRDIEPLNEKEISVVQWVFDHRQPAGRGTTTLPAAAGVFLPMVAARGPVGVLGLLDTRDTQDPERLHLLEAFASQSALALERAILADESRQAWERVEAEFLRNTLLSGVSHDLRTPLAAITGAASSLAESDGLGDDVRKELAGDIVAESERMERLITNLLDMTRLESGGFTLRKEWQPINEIIGTSLNHARKRLANHPVATHLPADLTLIHVDAIAMEEVLVNLLDNAALYTPAGTPIDITASRAADQMTLEIADQGPGLPQDDPQRVFQKFFRGGRRAGGKSDDGARRGVGLGLAICKGIVELHDGTITAENRPAGGALFRITLPIGGTPPPVPAELDTGQAHD